MSKAKIIILFLLIVLIQPICLAQSARGNRQVVGVRTKITRINKEIDRLNNLLEKPGISAARKKQLTKEIQLQQNSLKKLQSMLEQDKRLENKLAEIAAQPEEEISGEETIEAPASGEAAAKPVKPRFGLGARFGLFANTTGIFGQIRFPLGLIFGPATTGLRLSYGMSQTEDSASRKNSLQLDGILNYPPGIFSGVENYLGAGLNYVTQTEDGRVGTVGGEIFYGVESEGFGAKVFGEVGYGILRTGFSPSQKGLSLLVGFKRE